MQPLPCSIQRRALLSLPGPTARASERHSKEERRSDGAPDLVRVWRRAVPGYRHLALRASAIFHPYRRRTSHHGHWPGPHELADAESFQHVQQAVDVGLRPGGLNKERGWARIDDARVV